MFARSVERNYKAYYENVRDSLDIYKKPLIQGHYYQLFVLEDTGEVCKVPFIYGRAMYISCEYDTNLCVFSVNSRTIKLTLSDYLEDLWFVKVTSNQ